MPDKEIRITNIDNRDFYFKAAPHLKGKHEDWHNAYIRIITRLLDDIEVQTQPVELPAFPLLSNLSSDALLFEVASYWEGAVYFLCRVIGARTPLRGLRSVEKSIDDKHATFNDRLFIEIWNSYGQLKWLKAHLIREEKQDLLKCSANTKEEVRNAEQFHNDKDLIWLSSFVEQHEDEGNRYPNPYFGGMNPLHLGGILYANNLDKTNLFSDYTQKENHFTNGLVSVLKLASLEDLTFVSTFFKELLAIEITDAVTSFQVLEGYDENSTADAVLTTINTRVLFETKIVSATLIEKQIQKHLSDLKQTIEKRQYLILLTPDDSNSSYVNKERKAITVEVEISKVEETNEELGYPFTNTFAKNKLKVLETPIEAKVIEGIEGFENFTHERAPYRNLTHEQYNELVRTSLACPKPTL